MARRMRIWGTALLLWLSWAMPGWTASLLQRTADVETYLYGRPQEGALVVRLQRLESELGLAPAAGDEATPLGQRLERLEARLRGPARSESGQAPVAYAVGVMEWLAQARLTSDPLTRRVERLETAILGAATADQSLQQRVTTLTEATFAGSGLPARVVTIPAGTAVRVRLTQGASSATARAGQAIPFELAEDLIIDGALVAPAGTRGEATVIEARPSDQVGRAGSLRLSFGGLSLFDGTVLALGVDDQALQKNREAGYSAAEELIKHLLTRPGEEENVFLVRKDVAFGAGTPIILLTREKVQVTAYPLR